MNKFKAIFVLSAVFIFAGCSLSLRSESLSSANYFYLAENKDLSSVGRVAIVELENESDYPKISAALTESLYEQLQKRQIFGLSIVRKSDASWRGLQIPAEGSTGPVHIVYTVVKRSEIPDVVGAIQRLNPKAFFLVEDVRSVSEGVFRLTGPRYNHIHLLRKRKKEK